MLKFLVTFLFNFEPEMSFLTIFRQFIVNLSTYLKLIIALVLIKREAHASSPRNICLTIVNRQESCVKSSVKCKAYRSLYCVLIELKNFN
jgi:hypothetical protein